MFKDSSVSNEQALIVVKMLSVEHLDLRFDWLIWILIPETHFKKYPQTQILSTAWLFTQYCTCLPKSLLPYISKLAERQCDSCVVKQETPIPSLTKRLSVFQNKTKERQKREKERDFLVKSYYYLKLANAFCVCAWMYCTWAACRLEVWTVWSPCWSAPSPSLPLPDTTDGTPHQWHAPTGSLPRHLTTHTHTHTHTKNSKDLKWWLC